MELLHYMSKDMRGEPPALVLLHGFALDARMWRPQVDAFHGDHRVLTIDLPGFGPQAREVGIVAPARELGRAMDAAKFTRANLVATSFGAAVAVDFALQYPERVASLILAGPILLGRRTGIEAWPRCVALANEGDRTTAAEVWLDDPLFETLRREDSLFDDVRAIVLDYMGGHWTGRVSSTWAESDPGARLGELKVPTLVISGEADLPSFLVMADAYAKGIPHARREIIQGVGHFVSLEASSAFNEMVRGFIS